MARKKAEFTTVMTADGPASEPVGDRISPEVSDNPATDSVMSDNAAAEPAVDLAAARRAAYDAETCQLVREARARVYEAGCAYHAATKEAKRLRIALDDATDLLFVLIDQREKGSAETPLFDGLPEPEVPMGSAVGEDDAWRSEPLGRALKEVEHPVSEATMLRLIDAGLHTVGHLADWTKGNTRLTNVKGLGEARAAEVFEALSDFWADRQAAMDAAIQAEGEDPGDEGEDEEGDDQ